jgi:predicted RNase H-like HicB family nuclease
MMFEERVRKKEDRMRRRFRLNYWIDDGWYVGRLREVPGVFSQGETLEELELNIQDAFRLVMEDSEELGHDHDQTKEIEVEV